MSAQVLEGEQDRERGVHRELTSASPSECPIQQELLQKTKGDTVSSFAQRKTPTPECNTNGPRLTVQRRCFPPHSSLGFSGAVADLQNNPWNQNWAQEQLEGLTSQRLLSFTGYFAHPLRISERIHSLAAFCQSHRHSLCSTLNICSTV